MKTLIIGEKRSAITEMTVGLKDKIINSKNLKILENEGKRKGYIEGEKYILTWAMGHMFTIEIPKRININYNLFTPFKDLNMYKMEQLKTAPFVIDNDPTRYDKKYQKNQYDFCLSKRKQYNIILQQLKRNDYNEIILAADADAEGERIGTDLIVENLDKIPKLKKDQKKQLKKL